MILVTVILAEFFFSILNLAYFSPMQNCGLPTTVSARIITDYTHVRGCCAKHDPCLHLPSGGRLRV